MRTCSRDGDSLVKNKKTMIVIVLEVVVVQSGFVHRQSKYVEIC
jgi:hypothetical protein